MSQGKRVFRTAITSGYDLLATAIALGAAIATDERPLRVVSATALSSEFGGGKYNVNPVKWHFHGVLQTGTSLTVDGEKAADGLACHVQLVLSTEPLPEDGPFGAITYFKGVEHDYEYSEPFLSVHCYITQEQSDELRSAGNAKILPMRMTFDSEGLKFDSDIDGSGAVWIGKSDERSVGISGYSVNIPLIAKVEPLSDDILNETGQVVDVPASKAQLSQVPERLNALIANQQVFKNVLIIGFVVLSLTLYFKR